MTLYALSLAAAAFRRNPYPFAATGFIALALIFLGLIHPLISVVVGTSLLPMLYVGLGTLAEAEPGLRFTQSLRLALSAWPRTLALSALMFLCFFIFAYIWSASLSALYGDQLLNLAQTYSTDPAGFSQALIHQMNWRESAYGLAALALLSIGLVTLLWMAPLALVYHNLSLLNALRWSIQRSRAHFATLLPAVVVWILLSLSSGLLFGLSILVWPFAALFHFYCFRALGKQPV
jgi:hypothetical protein